jgi:hypothetical protein
MGKPWNCAVGALALAAPLCGALVPRPTPAAEPSECASAVGGDLCVVH